MNLRVWLGVIAVSFVAATSLHFTQAADDSKAVAAPTYSKDVAPIIQKNCQVCHRPGEAGHPAGTGLVGTHHAPGGI